MDRKQLGQERLGAPVMAAFETLVHTVDAQNWADIRREPVGYYFQKMIGNWLLQMTDKGPRPALRSGLGYLSAATSWLRK